MAPVGRQAASDGPFGVIPGATFAVKGRAGSRYPPTPGGGSYGHHADVPATTPTCRQPRRRAGHHADGPATTGAAWGPRWRGGRLGGCSPDRISRAIKPPRRSPTAPHCPTAPRRRSAAPPPRARSAGASWRPSRPAAGDRKLPGKRYRSRAAVPGARYLVEACPRIAIDPGVFHRSFPQAAWFHVKLRANEGLRLWMTATGGPAIHDPHPRYEPSG